MPWLEYEADVDDLEAQAAWEATEGEGPAPELQHVTNQVEVQGEARLTFTGTSGYQNLALGAGGITSVKIIDPPAEETPPVAQSAKAKEK